MSKDKIFACILWTASLIASLIIKPGSAYIHLPDALLLAGFLPLLVAAKPAWPWFVFGILNVVIGFALQTSECIPAGTLPKESLPIKEHLKEMHVPIVWILFGLLALACGIIKIIGGLISWLMKKGRN